MVNYKLKQELNLAISRKNAYIRGEVVTSSHPSSFS
jgi:hypothetical protein